MMAVKDSETISTKEATISMVYKRSQRCKFYNSWKEKIMHGQLLRDLSGKDSVQSWKRAKNSDLNGGKDALICSAQDQAIDEDQSQILYRQDQ